MSGPSSSAIDNHLRRYEVSSDAGDDSDSSATGSTSCHRSAASSSPSRVKETFWSTVFADTSHPLASSVSDYVRKKGLSLEHVDCALYLELRQYFNCRNLCCCYAALLDTYDTLLLNFSCSSQRSGNQPTVEQHGVSSPSALPGHRPVVAPATTAHRAVYPRTRGNLRSFCHTVRTARCASSWILLCLSRPPPNARPRRYRAAGRRGRLVFSVAEPLSVCPSRSSSPRGYKLGLHGSRWRRCGSRCCHGRCSRCDGDST